jgi:hypothetical protein
MNAPMHASHPYTASEALARLVEGNERFVRGVTRFPTVQKEVLAELENAQHPYATILGCSDSRVPLELVFDAGFGELFVIPAPVFTRVNSGRNPDILSRRCSSTFLRMNQYFYDRILNIADESSSIM